MTKPGRKQQENKANWKCVFFSRPLSLLVYSATAWANNTHCVTFSLQRKRFHFDSRPHVTSSPELVTAFHLKHADNNNKSDWQSCALDKRDRMSCCPIDWIFHLSVHKSCSTDLMVMSEKCKSFFTQSFRHKCSKLLNGKIFCSKWWRKDKSWWLWCDSMSLGLRTKRLYKKLLLVKSWIAYYFPYSKSHLLRLLAWSPADRMGRALFPPHLLFSQFHSNYMRWAANKW